MEGVERVMVALGIFIMFLILAILHRIIEERGGFKK